MNLIIHAPNVHRGGGKTLLLNLLQAMGGGKQSCLVITDERLEPPLFPQNIEVIRFPPTIMGRASAEICLRTRATPKHVVLCLGNLPPFFRLEAQKIFLFLHNRHLLDLGTSGFTLPVRLRNTIERFWLRKRIGGVHQLIVQSPSMATLARDCLGITPVIAPFTAIDEIAIPQKIVSRNLRAAEAVFLYVASGEPHKNHRRLVEAWIILAAAGINPALRLTINPAHHHELAAWIADQGRRYNLRIENTGEVEPAQLSRMYDEATALIYPSFAESLGLPLLEARSHGLPVIASERDFVRDIIAPHQTFDPESALSISRAVRRFLEIEEPPLKIGTPDEFLQAIMDDSHQEPPQGLKKILTGSNCAG